MADVEVFRRVRGQKIERVIARHVDVQAALRANGNTIAIRAQRILRSGPHSEGHSRITTNSGKIDRWVVLADYVPAGERKYNYPNAMAIEMGTKRTRAVAPLRRAAGLL